MARVDFLYFVSSSLDYRVSYQHSFRANPVRIQGLKTNVGPDTYPDPRLKFKAEKQNKNLVLFPKHFYKYDKKSITFLHTVSVLSFTKVRESFILILIFEF